MQVVHYLLVSNVICHFLIVYCTILCRTAPNLINQYAPNFWHICLSCIAEQDPGNCFSTSNEAPRLIQNWFSTLTLEHSHRMGKYSWYFNVWSLICLELLMEVINAFLIVEEHLLWHQHGTFQLHPSFQLSVKIFYKKTQNH